MLRDGKDIPLVDRTIVSSISIEGRSALAARLAIVGVFSSLQETCIERNEAETLTGLQADFVASARKLYKGLEILSKSPRLQPAEWTLVATGLRAGWRYFPSPLYAGQLETAFRQSKDRRGLFEFKAYRYFDESGPNLFRSAGLLLKWLFMPGRKGFGEEIAAVKKSIKDDISRTSPGVAALPVFGGEKFLTSAGATQLLAFTDPGSGLYGKRAVFAFFDTTCSYCVEELKALARLAPLYERRSRGSLALIGVKIPSRLPPVISALALFEKGLTVPFPLLENDASGVYAAYGVRSVPLLIFFDERGVPLWSVAFRGQGRLDEKLSWFLDDFLADARPAPQLPTKPGAPSITVDFYFDASSVECQAFIDGDVPGLVHSFGVSIEIVPHDLRVASVSGALENRLASLRSIRSEMPIAILGGKAIQGIAAIKRALREAVRTVVRNRR
jgi:hypothetical protein